MQRPEYNAYISFVSHLLCRISQRIQRTFFKSRYGKQIKTKIQELFEEEFQKTEINFKALIEKVRLLMVEIWPQFLKKHPMYEKEITIPLFDEYFNNHLLETIHLSLELETE